LHCKIAIEVFRGNDAILGQLNLSNASNGAYMSWLAKIKKFYLSIMPNDKFGPSYTALNLSEKEVVDIKSKIAEYEAIRIKYFNKKGTSKLASKREDIAFNLLENWMADFYAITRVEMQRKPQLVEVLEESGKI